MYSTLFSVVFSSIPTTFTSVKSLDKKSLVVGIDNQGARSNVYKKREIRKKLSLPKHEDTFVYNKRHVNRFNGLLNTFKSLFIYRYIRKKILKYYILLCKRYRRIYDYPARFKVF